MLAGSGPGAAQRPGSVCRALGDDFVVALEETSRKINDPVAKLRYLRGSIAEYEESQAHRRPPSKRPTPALFGLAAVATVAFGAAAWYFSRPAVAAAPAPSLARPAVAEELPALPLGVAARRDLARGEDRGLGAVQQRPAHRHDATRSRASRATTGSSRPGAGKREEALDQPMGIVFHTSESDIWPLDESYNENLRTQQPGPSALPAAEACLQLPHRPLRAGLPGGARTRRKPTTPASPCGRRTRPIYLGLNGSFLGVSFETRWEGGRALPITAAQLSAGRNLTDWLRQKW